MRRVLNSLIDSLFPPHQDAITARTATEESLLEKLRLNFNQKTNTYTGLPYSDPMVRALIRANKFQSDPHSADILGSVLFEMLSQVSEEYALDSNWNNPILIPIPSSKKKHRLRGDSQVERIVRTLPKATLIHYQPHTLQRHDRKSQTHVARSKRA